MKSEDIVIKIQYANVRHAVSRAHIRHHREIAAEYGFQAIINRRCWVSMTKEVLRGININVATAIAYPMGGETTDMEVAMAREVVPPCDWPHAARHGVQNVGVVEGLPDRDQLGPIPEPVTHSETSCCTTPKLLNAMVTSSASSS